MPRACFSWRKSNTCESYHEVTYVYVEIFLQFFFSDPDAGYWRYFMGNCSDEVEYYLNVSKYWPWIYRTIKQGIYCVQ